MKVSVDRAACTGHAQCYAVAPDVYDIDDEGFCLLPDEDVRPGLEEQARRGADACPECAITIIES